MKFAGRQGHGQQFQASRSQGLGKEGFSHLFPLWMLKYLPNMAACHISIAYDVQVRTIRSQSERPPRRSPSARPFASFNVERPTSFWGGGTDSKIHPLSIVRMALLNRLTKRNEIPEEAIRPFDKSRDGIVPGEGTAALLFEELGHAKRRNAEIYAEVLGYGAYCDPRDAGRSISKAIDLALKEARLSPSDLGHISAIGASGKQEDKDEARGIAQVLGPAHRQGEHRRLQERGRLAVSRLGCGGVGGKHAGTSSRPIARGPQLQGIRTRDAQAPHRPIG